MALPRCLLLLLSLQAALAWSLVGAKKEQTIEEQLIASVLAQGGKLDGFAIGQACPTCLRGVVASKDLKPDDILVRVPFKAIMRLKDLAHSAFPAEFARDLLDAMHNDPQHNATWGLFWSAHPGPEGTFTPEVYTDAHLEMLQAPALEELARGQREVTEQVYAGTYTFHPYNPFTEVVPEEKVSLETFKYVASLIGSRYFGFFRDGEAQTSASHLVPLVDLINHANDPNAERSDDGTDVFVRAIKHIKKGEEITNSYQPGVIHRPDMSLYVYGFVTPMERPLLSAIDLPNYNPADPFGQTALTDAIYNKKKGSKYVSKKEYDRLAALLAAAPTSESEDQALLDGGSVTDWREQAILQFRIMRKRALRQTLEKLAAKLGLDADGKGSAEDAAAELLADAAAAAAEEGSEAEQEDVQETAAAAAEEEVAAAVEDEEEEEQEAPHDEF